MKFILQQDSLFIINTITVRYIFDLNLFIYFNELYSSCKITAVYLHYTLNGHESIILNYKMLTDNFTQKRKC